MTYYNIVRRNSGDTSPIFFEWTSDSVTFTAQVSKNGGPYVPVVGAVAYERTEGASHLWSIAYNAADRPSEGTAEYKLNDGTTVRIIPFAVDTSAGGSGGDCDVDAIIDGVVEGLGDTIVISQPVSPGGQITGPIIIGDDYLAANGRAFEWTVGAVAGMAAVDLTAQFGGAHRSKGSWLVEGVVSDNGDSTWNLSFDLPRSATEDCKEGSYEWSVQVTDGSGNEVTTVINDGDCYKVQLVDKQT